MMPEGPEIRRAADKLLLALKALPISEVRFSFDHLKRYEPVLKGQSVIDVETRGKAMLIRFSNDLSIYTHNQLYGRWVVRKAYDYPKTNRQLRLAIRNERKSALLYSASDIDVLTPAQIAIHPYLAKLGLDVLCATPNAVLDRLRVQKYRRRQFSALLLDQGFLAGIGNYLRSEILFTAGLHPYRRPVDCSEDQLERLAIAAATIPRQSYRHNGITNDLEQARALKAEGQRRSQYRHWVFGRASKPCRVCGHEIAKEVAAGRRVYFCLICQPPI
jgi:endonuclease-8